MGLFIGASILTILELVDYLYEVVKVRTHFKFFQTALRFAQKVIIVQMQVCETPQI